MKKIQKYATTAILLFILSVVPVSSVYAETETQEETSVTTEAGSALEEATGEKSGNASAPEIPSNHVWPAAPNIDSESALIMEASTSTVLFEKDADTMHYPASTTKIMTALIALENCALDEEVTFSKSAVDLEEAASNIKAVAGEKMPMIDVLYGLMVASGNDCANAIAEHVAGSVPAFADMMNERAAEIGCTGTHFTNPHGLFDKDHYTTARDLALIMQEAIKNATLVDLISAVEYTAAPTNKDPEPKTFTTYDLHKDPESDYYYEDVVGGKTGFLDEAGRCLVSYAEHDGFPIITVQLKGGYEQIFDEAIKLFNYAFKNFSMRNVAGNEPRFSSPAQDAPICLDPSAQILTLNSLKFEQLESTLTFANDIDIERRADLQMKAAEEPGRSIYAVIDYSYAGHALGSANVYEDQTLTIAPSAFTLVNYVSPIYLVLFVLVVLIAAIFAFAHKKKRPARASVRSANGPPPRRR